jgi:hypothetical protein
LAEYFLAFLWWDVFVKVQPCKIRDYHELRMMLSNGLFELFKDYEVIWCAVNALEMKIRINTCLGRR